MQSVDLMDVLEVFLVMYVLYKPVSMKIQEMFEMENNFLINNQNVWSLCYDATLAYKVLQREHVAPLDANLAAVLDMLATLYMGVLW